MKVKHLIAFLERVGVPGEVDVLFNEGGTYSESWKPLDPKRIKIELRPVIEQAEVVEDTIG